MLQRRFVPAAAMIEDRVGELWQQLAIGVAKTSMLGNAHPHARECMRMHTYTHAHIHSGPPLTAASAARLKWNDATWAADVCAHVHLRACTLIRAWTCTQASAQMSAHSGVRQLAIGSAMGRLTLQFQ